jgi:DNA-directed RNA polymerase subunit L
MEPINIKIKELEKVSSDGLLESHLVLGISGKSINLSIVGTLRRVVASMVPTYAFSDKLIKIDNNTSIFNNDEMRLRLSQLPILNIDSGISSLSSNYWKDLDYSLEDLPKHPKDKHVIEFFVDVSNETNHIKNVTTNDLKVLVDGKPVQMYSKKYPILLIKQKRMEVYDETKSGGEKKRKIEKFTAYGKSMLSIGKHHIRWSPVNRIFATSDEEDKDDDDPHKFQMYVESGGQFDEYVILTKGCDAIISRLDELKVELGTKYADYTKSSGGKLSIEIEEEDHTMGNLINYALQSHPNVIKSGYTEANRLENKIDIKMHVEGVKPLQPFFDSVKYLRGLFEHLKVQLIELSKRSSSKPDKSTIGTAIKSKMESYDKPVGKKHKKTHKRVGGKKKKSR